MARQTALVVVVDNAADARAVSTWIADQLPDDAVAFVVGFYAGVAAVERHTPVVVIDVGAASPRQEWQIAELRAHLRRATIVVVASADHLATLAGALAADLAVTSAGELPPLREVLIGAEPAVAPKQRAQTSRRRSTR